MNVKLTTAIGIISTSLDPVEALLKVDGWACGGAGGIVKVDFAGHTADVSLPNSDVAADNSLYPVFWSVAVQLSQQILPTPLTVTAIFHDERASMVLEERVPKIFISRARFVGGKIDLKGWCTGRQSEDFVEVRLFGELAGKAKFTARRDVQDKFPLMADSKPGFSFSAPAPIALADGRVWVEVRLRRGSKVLAAASRLTESDGEAPLPPRRALQAILNPFPAAGSQRALARSFTPSGRRRLLASRAFQQLWATGDKYAAFALRTEIVRAMIEFGEVVGPMKIRLESGHLLEADPRKDSVIARRFLLDGTYEAGLINTLTRFLKKGDKVFDIGSCYGHVAFACASAVGREGEVISIEPNPVMASALRKSLERNHLKQVQVVEVALGDTPGTATLRVASHNIGGSRLGVEGVTSTDKEFGDIIGNLSVVSLGTSELGEPMQSDPECSKLDAFEVKMKTLDELAEEYGCPQLLKIDIEGAELLCLRGGRKLLAGDFGEQPIITMEYSNLFPTFGGRREDAFELLIAAGYSAYRMTKGKVGGGDLIEVPNSESAPDHDDLFFIPPGRESFAKK